MKTEHQPFALALLDEQVLALQLTNQLIGVVLSADVGGQVGVECTHDRQAREETQQGWRQSLQELFTKEPGNLLEGVLRQELWGIGWTELRQARTGVAAKAEQDPADPAFAVGAQQIQQVAVQALSARARQLADLAAVQDEVANFQRLQTLIAAQVAERNGGLAFAGGQQMKVFRRVTK
ncbi:hypothetical protein D3C71_1708390 [compost metagenome]